MISNDNDFQVFQTAGFAELLGCISIAEARASADKFFADLVRREAEVATQEALVIREISAATAAVIRKAPWRQQPHPDWTRWV